MQRRANLQGGRGNCAKCAVRVAAGKAAVNTMDRVWFTPAQLAEGWRLGCQVYAREPLTVEIDPR
ncbi:MAG: 2Fe-2S iron-sulfur cluster-binding protein [Eubacteriales bacterium]